jgi:hypothetical protein
MRVELVDLPKLTTPIINVYLGIGFVSLNELGWVSLAKA